ncbi:hypothetical protein [Roseibacillus ishigakijimensis]|uniref:Uncharacterized protein n=1 Tax=Roseibacillus ishigakijimensis TaxID=454146 RepID=A0A934VLD7_9BACT|nr:hypothetical protein [Roseibacillus ishigakijimensis]MBK1833132.1 hypothetical protein [Roseibacillus ishigakijimensis]
MKIFYLLAFSVTSLFGMDLPRHVFTLDKLAEAKAEASENKQPLIFVYTDLGTT